MSFNDLERGASPTPGNGNRRNGGGGGLNGQALGRGAGAGGGGGGTGFNGGSQGRAGGSSAARGPLPLYHSPTSSGSSFAAAGESQAADPEFKKLADRIGIQIFKLNSNVQGIDKLVELQTRALRKNAQSGRGDGVAQGSNDKDWTTQIHDLTETTRTLTKDLSGELKELLSFAAQRQEQLSSTDRVTASKLQREFEAAINAFARTQRESAKLSKSMLEGAKEERERALKGSASRSAGESAGKDTANDVAVNETLVQVDQEDGDGQDDQQQQQVQKTATAGPSQAELEFQETLIAERESDIREIETGIHELNEIFRDLGHIVQEQGGMIDNIEYNITSIATNTGAADRELVQASDYQRKAGRRAACLLLIVGFVVAVVLLAILS